MTSEQVMDAFKEKGIEVKIYQTPFSTIEKVVIDTYNHDKQIKSDVIDDFADYLKKNFRIGVNTIDEVVKSYKEQK